MMVNRFSKAALALALALAPMVVTETGGTGVKHIVGDSIWSIPPTKNFYDKWSSSRAFHVGDSLYFEFESTRYNVIEVSWKDFSRCEKDILIPWKRYNDGPTLVPLEKEGEIYYICNWLDYCSLGMKFTVFVNRSDTS